LRSLPDVVGAILAGGAGSRLGAPSKAAAELAGRPLIAYPAAALAGVCTRVVVVCKPSTSLPSLDGIERWDEAESPQHPAVGIAHALREAGEAVLVCAADMPFVTADACRTILTAAGPESSAAVAVAGGVLQPVFGVYAPAALEAFSEASPDASLTATVEALQPARVALPPALVRSVNTPEELAEAEAELSG
jgi:molybdopterin-guanine dinucleotide biosynthesis protein A